MRYIIWFCFFFWVKAGLYAQTPPRNLVVILADDLGWRDLGCMGSRYYETPRLDALAANSLRFTQAYAAAPVCAPTRAALMTGKSPARLHLTAVFDRDGGEMPLLPPVWTNELPLQELTLAERLHALGYHTAHIGKWHLGLEENGWPAAHGFVHNVAGWKSGRPGSYFSPYQNPRLTDGPEGEYLTRRLASEAEAYLASRAGEEAPFFLYLPFYSPHAPLEAPEPSIARFRDRGPDGGQAIPEYAAMVAELDAAVGRILDALAANGLAENTLVVFTSDNGGVLTLWDQRITDNAPLRGEKFLLYEGGIRVPMLVHWPGAPAMGDSCSQLISTQDLLPSLLGAIGEPVSEPGLDGLDLSGVFWAGEAAKVDRSLGWHYPHYMPRQNMRPSSAWRSGRWKLLHWHESHELQLFDLRTDPGETTDLGAEMPEQALLLYQQLDAWRQRVGAQMPRPNPGWAE